jgi:hypothetical protein
VSASQMSEQRCTTGQRFLIQGILPETIDGRAGR